MDTMGGRRREEDEERKRIKDVWGWANNNINRETLSLEKGGQRDDWKQREHGFRWGSQWGWGERQTMANICCNLHLSLLIWSAIFVLVC